MDFFFSDQNQKVFTGMHTPIITIQDNAEAGGGQCALYRTVHEPISGGSV